MSAGPGCPNQPLSPAQEVILRSGLDGTDLPDRWIQDQSMSTISGMPSAVGASASAASSAPITAL